MSRTETEAPPHGGLRPADGQGERPAGQGLGHHRPPRGDQGRRLRRRHDPGRRPRGLRHRLRDPAEVRRRPVHRRLARARRRLPRPAAPSPCSSTSPATWQSSPSPARSCSSTPTPWPPTAWPWARSTRRALRRPLPRRADDARPDRRLLRRAQGGDHLHLRRHQPHGLVPARSSTRAATSTRAARGLREARVLQEREGPRRGLPPLRLLHDRVAPATSREYVPWFRKNKKALDLYCDEPSFGGESGAYYKYCKAAGRQVRQARPAGVRVHQDRLAAASSTARTSWRRSPPASRSASWATSATTATSPTCPTAAASRCRPSPTTPACTRRVIGDAAAAVRGRLHDQRQRADPGRRGGAAAATPEHIVHAARAGPADRRPSARSRRSATCAARCWRPQRQWLPQFAGKKIRPTPTISIPHGLQARRRAARPGPGDQPALRQADRRGQDGRSLTFHYDTTSTTDQEPLGMTRGTPSSTVLLHHGLRVLHVPLELAGGVLFGQAAEGLVLDRQRALVAGLCQRGDHALQVDVPVRQRAGVRRSASPSRAAPGASRPGSRCS